MTRNATLPFQKDFTAAELSARRALVMSEMGSGLAVIHGASEVPGFDPIRQTNDFYYLTGVETPGAYLTLDAVARRTVIYLPPRDPKHEATDGPSLSDEDGEFLLERTGIDQVHPIANLIADLSGLTGQVWLMRSPAEGPRQCQDTLRHYHKAILADPLDGQLSRESHFLSRLAQFSPLCEFRNLSPIVHRLRLLKSPAEADVRNRVKTT